MSSFWSAWIIVLTVSCIILVTWVLFANRTVDKKEGEQTTGHNYDGIEEYDNPLPSWWFNLFVVSVLFAFGYLALYPGLGNYKGFLNWSAASEMQQDVEAAEAEFVERSKQYMSIPAKQLATDRAAVKMGHRIFKSNCAVCHGADAKGSYAFPNLTDDDWLYGNSEEKITQSITFGRKGMMPGWQSILGDDLDAMTDYVIKLGQEDVSQHPMKEKFAMLCSACHTADGTGNKMLGAPNLTDNIWLYGGSDAEVRLTLQKGRNGNMPAHKDILSKERIHLVISYLYSLQEK